MPGLLHRFLLGLLIGLAPALHAATIAEIDTVTLANRSQLVFQGEVLATRAEQAPNGRIYSFVDFQVEDVLVGSLKAGSVLTLRFAGGQVGDIAFSAGVVIPQPGERGIYFVESLDKGLINPLLGWSQGHFRIGRDSTLTAGNGELVVGLETVEGASPLRLSEGVARGVTTRSREALQAQARGQSKIVPMTLDAFKSRIRALHAGGAR